MDAIKYLKTKYRMCKGNADSCESCPLYLNNGIRVACRYLEMNYPERAIELVEKWAAEHPAKTRQSELMKVFPNLQRDLAGTCAICPQRFDGKLNCPEDTDCRECRCKYWLEEIN